MSQHPRKNVRRRRRARFVPGNVPPLREVSRHALGQAARAARASGHSGYADSLRSELRAPALRPPVIGVRLLEDSDARVYSVKALLRHGLVQPINVRAGIDLSQFTELTSIGRALGSSIAALYGVNFVVVNRHELYVDISSSFEWDEDDDIHAQILNLIYLHLGLVEDDCVIKVTGWSPATDSSVTELPPDGAAA